jgi:hypothetical protein
VVVERVLLALGVEEPSWWGLILSMSACEPHHHRPSFGLVVCVESPKTIASVRHESSGDAVGLCGDAGERSVTDEDGSISAGLPPGPPLDAPCFR